MTANVVPAWTRGYRREWLRFDLIAGVVIWSVVTPQAVAYAQIAGLPPEAGLMAAPGAMIAYGLIGTSRQLVVSATTATSAVSAAAVGPLADGDAARFMALSAALALVTAAVLVAAGLLRLGAVSDLVSKPVMTGFLFGLGMTITIGQLPAVLGVPAGTGNFFPRLWDLVSELSSIHAATLAFGLGSIAVLLLGRRLITGLPVDPARARARHRGVGASRPRRARRRRRGRHPGRAARPRRPPCRGGGPRRPRRARLRGAHRQRGGDRGGTVARHPARLHGRAQPRPRRARRRERAGRPVVGLRAVRRRPRTPSR